MKLFFRLVSILAVFAFYASNAYSGIKDLTYYSPSMKKDISIKVYTPPGYENSNQRYPVVYNLHGGGGSPQRQWERTGKTIQDAMENHKVRPMIYVYTNGLGNTEYLDQKDGKTLPSTSLIKELIPFIDKTYRTISSREGRAIDGFSMGGFGCLYHAFKYPELFSSVVSYGGALSLNREEHPNNYAKLNADIIRKTVRIKIVVGKDDKEWGPGSYKMRDLLKSLNIPVQFVELSGIGHCTQCLYEKEGVASMIFMFGSPSGPTPTITPTPTPTPTATPVPDNYTITLNKNWNLISLPLLPSNTNIENVLSGIKGLYAAVYAYDGKNYETYVPGGPSNTLNKMIPGRGYWIFMNEKSSLTVKGSPASLSIDLEKDWNLVGFNSMRDIYVKDAFNPIKDELVVAYIYNSETNSYDLFMPHVLDDQHTMMKGQGYWLLMRSKKTWTLPSSN
jgi:enterochelin esterase-like enzyme